MNKITQKEFKETLIKNKSLRIGTIHNKKLDDVKNLIINSKLDDEKINASYKEVRTVEKVQTNAIMFNNKSWLHFDVKVKSKEYYKKDNIILLNETYENNNNFMLVYQII